MAEGYLRVAFTGHRPFRLGGWQRGNAVELAVRGALADYLVDLCRDGPVETMSGMALGFDMWAADVCVELGIPFSAAVPFEGQERRWPSEAQTVYKRLLNQARAVTVVSEGGYSVRAMLARNHYLVDWAQLVVAAWDGGPSGTAECLAYANNRKVNTHNLWREEWRT